MRMVPSAFEENGFPSAILGNARCPRHQIDIFLMTAHKGRGQQISRLSMVPRVYRLFRIW
jgi:hypothetical protein